MENLDLQPRQSTSGRKSANSNSRTWRKENSGSAGGAQYVEQPELPGEAPRRASAVLCKRSDHWAGHQSTMPLDGVEKGVRRGWDEVE